MMLFYIIISITLIVCARADEEIAAQNSNGSLLCGSIMCPNDTMICIYKKQSTVDLISIANGITCVGSNGTILLESDTAEPNSLNNKTDITSITILGLNTNPLQHQQYINNIIAVTKSMMNKSSDAVPTMQVIKPSPSTSSQQYPIIIAMPPASPPVISITNPIMMPPIYTSSMYTRNACIPPECFTTSMNSVSSARERVLGDSPNLQPPSLDAIYRIINDIRSSSDSLERAVKDASAAVPPPTYGPANNVAFPVPIPYNPSIY